VFLRITGTHPGFLTAHNPTPEEDARRITVDYPLGLDYGEGCATHGGIRERER